MAKVNSKELGLAIANSIFLSTLSSYRKRGDISFLQTYSKFVTIGGQDEPGKLKKGYHLWDDQPDYVVFQHGKAILFEVVASQSEFHFNDRDTVGKYLTMLWTYEQFAIKAYYVVYWQNLEIWQYFPIQTIQQRISDPTGENSTLEAVKFKLKDGKQLTLNSNCRKLNLDKLIATKGVR